MPVGEPCCRVDVNLFFKVVTPPHPRCNVEHGHARDPLPNGTNFASSNIAAGVRGIGPWLLMIDSGENPWACQLAK